LARRHAIALLGGAVLAGLLPGSVNADTAAVPFGLQVDLFAKVADYDKTLPGRSQGLVRVVVVVRSGVPESVAAGARVLNALSSVPRISGLPHEDSVVELPTPEALADLCRSRSIGILYLSPGLLDADEAIAKALSGVPVLTVSSTADGARRGAALGFDLVGGKPKLLVNLPVCTAQGIRLSSDVLKIATVIP